ncbi:hypothetical protein [Acerihabitans arboris]|uniref:Uncharacterized protein n=1 Tax=Acerihabitans arboris TaxID=2691583 RepID=A0A845SFB8_9GAMM|nr:hypothetical protein [Acerihabitans arboris]NDL61634.1 hypothetical protein [Acerihabitans arboris]
MALRKRSATAAAAVDLAMGVAGVFTFIEDSGQAVNPPTAIAGSPAERKPVVQWVLRRKRLLYSSRIYPHQFNGYMSPGRSAFNRFFLL